MILCGFKSSGKSTLARKIAERLQITCIDTDSLISDDCRALSLKIGEKAFRLLEKKAIHALSRMPAIKKKKAVIASGGGAILDPENVALFKKMGKLVYLQVEKEELKKRLLQNPLPSFFDPQDPEGSFEKMYAERAPIYEQAADCIVRSEEELWQVIHSEKLFASSHGENPTERPSAPSSTAARPV